MNGMNHLRQKKSKTYQFRKKKLLKTNKNNPTDSEK